MFQVQRPQTGFGGPAPETTTTSETKRKAPPLGESDLRGLSNSDSKVRLEAFAVLADKLTNDLDYPQANYIARQLLLMAWKESELDKVTKRLKNLTNCRALLQAVADVISENDKSLDQQRSQTITGALVGKRLDDEDWQSDCRKELLQRALELTPARSTSGTADEAAGFLRDLYKEQGQAFGLDDDDFNGQTRLTGVLERLIKHVADRSAQQEVSPTNKDVLTRIGREIEVARFIADNDIQYAVLLQRIWIKVLSLTLQRDATASDGKKMADLVNDLKKKDRNYDNLLAQLRAGEEQILRLWALAKISN